MKYKFVYKFWLKPEFILIALTIMLAVTCITSVLLLSTSLSMSIDDKTGVLLGGDRLINSPTPIDKHTKEEAQRQHLNITEAISFLTMIVHNDDLTLTNVIAIEDNYPLKGSITIDDKTGPAFAKASTYAKASSHKSDGRPASTNLQINNTTSKIPEIGTVWLEPRVFSLLNISLGDIVQIGEAKFIVAATVNQAPGKSFDVFNLAPRGFINIVDLGKTNLIQPGTRVNYQLFLSGNARDIAQFDQWIPNQLLATQRYLNASSSNSMIKRNLENAYDYLSLILLANLSFAGIAIALVSKRFCMNQIETVAILRCFGMPFNKICLAYIVSLLLYGILAGCLGLCFGFLLFKGFSWWILKSLTFSSAINIINLQSSTDMIQLLKFPLLIGFVTTILLLFAFSMPFFISLRQVTAIRVLRRDLPPPNISLTLMFSLALGFLLLFVSLQVSNPLFINQVVIYLIIISIGIYYIMYKGFSLFRPLSNIIPSQYRFPIRNLAYYAKDNAIQVLAFSLAIMLFCFVFIVRGNLAQTWFNQTKAGLPNYFAINIPKSSLEQFEKYFNTLQKTEINTPSFYPLIRARLLTINNNVIDLSRLLNTTYTIQLPHDNHIVEGKWFTDLDNYQNSISVEKGFAERMNIHLADKLSFQIEEEKIDVTVTSIRQVVWDSFNPNFFVIFAPGIIDQFESSYMTSFYLPKAQSAFLNNIVKQFPMISLIDIEEIINEIKNFLDLLNIMLQYLFSFTLLMGLLLLAVSLLSTVDERQQENKLLRILGASNKTLLMNNFIYYLILGLLSGIIASVGAIGLAYGFSYFVLHTSFTLPMNILWLAPIGASFIICLFGVVAARTKL